MPHIISGLRARLWWRYSYKVAVQQLRGSRMSWLDLKRAADLRKDYVPHYVKCLQQGKTAGDERIAAMDAQLQEGTIILFRRMAHSIHRAAQAKDAKRDKPVPSPADKASSGGGWFGWLTGGKKPAEPKATEKAEQSAAQQSGDMKAELGPEEWRLLEKLVSEEESKLEDSKETPFTLKMRLHVKVQTAALQLHDMQNAQIMSGCLNGVNVAMLNYPETSQLELKVAGAAINTCQGALLSTGQISGRAGSANAALELEYTGKPQDGRADAVVKLALAPSYVTYNKHAIKRITDFFTMKETANLSRLTAQATARAEQLRQMANLRLRALTLAEQKPKLLLSISMHAPKVAIPAQQGATSLIADLGLFTLNTDRQLAQSLSVEEAAVYECFSLRLDNVSAYLVDGAVDWSSVQQSVADLGRSGAAGPSTGPQGPREGTVSLAVQRQLSEQAQVRDNSAWQPWLGLGGTLLSCTMTVRPQQFATISGCSCCSLQALLVACATEGMGCFPTTPGQFIRMRRLCPSWSGLGSASSYNWRPPCTQNTQQ